MKEVQVRAIYVVTDRLHSSYAKKRLADFLTKIKSDNIYEISASELDKVNNYEKSFFSHHKVRKYQKSFLPVVIFSGFDWTDPHNDPRNIASDIEHYEKFTFARYRNARDTRGIICQNAFELNTAFGCFHGCSYCHTGDVFFIHLDVEQVIEKLDDLLAATDQKLYKIGNQSDLFLLEPEYNCLPPFINYFAGKKDRYLTVFTRSDNIDFLLGIPHNKHTIITYSITPQPIIDAFEDATSSLSRRIEAMIRLNKAGYPVRIRFSPIIPAQNFVNIYKETIREIHRNFTKDPSNICMPDIFSLNYLAHMTNDDLKAIFNKKEQVLETGFYNEELGEQEYIYELFPAEKRIEGYVEIVREIKKYFPQTTVSFCLETAEVNKALGQDIDNYYCTCGRQSV